MKENKNIKGQFNIMKSQKKYLTTEGNTNKQLIEDLKINNEQLIKERDDYKIKNQKLMNDLLKKEKEFLGQRNDELQKRISSMDKRTLRNKSIPGKNSPDNT